MPVVIDGVKFTPIPVDHLVPTHGFLIEQNGASVLWSSDTGPTHRFWEIANRTPNLKALCIETSFDNALQQVADVSLHLTPQTLEVGAAQAAAPGAHPPAPPEAPLRAAHQGGGPPAPQPGPRVPGAGEGIQLLATGSPRPPKMWYRFLGWHSLWKTASPGAGASSNPPVSRASSTFPPRPRLRGCHGTPVPASSASSAPRAPRRPGRRCASASWARAAAATRSSSSPGRTVC